MENITLNINELKHIIQQSVKEAVSQSIHEEMMKLRLSLLQYVSEKEQSAIESLYGSPENNVADSVEIEI